MRRVFSLLTLCCAATPLLAQGPKVSVTFPASRSATPLDGRLLLLLSTDTTAEPRNQISDINETQLVFGRDVDGWAAGRPVVVDVSVDGYPIESLRDVPAGRYRVQALLNRYETFHRADGHVVKLPPDRGEGQQWNSKPGNLYSMAQWITFNPARADVFRIVLDQEIPPIADPPDTKYVRHIASSQNC